MGHYFGRSSTSCKDFSWKLVTHLLNGKALYYIECCREDEKCALSPLFPHPPAALGELIASGSELMGLCVGEAASPVSVPGGAQPPPGAATAVLQRARAALHSSRSLTVGQKRSQPFAAGPTSAWGAGLGREVVRTPGTMGEEGWLRSGILHLSLRLAPNRRWRPTGSRRTEGWLALVCSARS